MKTIELMQWVPILNIEMKTIFFVKYIALLRPNLKQEGSVIVMTTGAEYWVKETVEEIMDLIRIK